MDFEAMFLNNLKAWGLQTSLESIYEILRRTSQELSSRMFHKTWDNDNIFQANIQLPNNVVTTSLQRRDVAATL